MPPVGSVSASSSYAPYLDSDPNTLNPPAPRDFPDMRSAADYIRGDLNAEGSQGADLYYVRIAGYKEYLVDMRPGQRVLIV